MNLGASSSEEYGAYFSWGETVPKAYVGGNATYRWCQLGFYNDMYKYFITKYNTDYNSGTLDNKTRLDLEDDSAAALLGGKWRMPSKPEIDELIDNCTWTKGKTNGIDGYTVKSMINGNSIFIPLAGAIDAQGGLLEIGEQVYLLSSSLSGDSKEFYWYAYTPWLSFAIHTDIENGIYSTIVARTACYPIRPVLGQ